MNAIAGRVRSLSGEYQMLGGDLKQGTGPDGEKPDTLTEEERKKQEEEVKKRAQADVKAALDGDKGAVERVQNVLNTVSKEQQAGQAKLNAEQQAYLSQMQAQQKLRSVAQLEEAANNGAQGHHGRLLAVDEQPEGGVPEDRVRRRRTAIRRDDQGRVQPAARQRSADDQLTRYRELGEPAEGRRHRRRAATTISRRTPTSTAA